MLLIIYENSVKLINFFSAGKYFILKTKPF